MPELPEVETMRRGILDAIGGVVQTIDTEPCPRLPISIEPSIGRIQKRVAGAELTAVDRVGKRIVLRFSTEECLVIEPRMTGLVLVADPPTIEHLRVRVDLTGSKIRKIWFWDRRGLGTVRLLNPNRTARAIGARPNWAPTHCW